MNERRDSHLSTGPSVHEPALPKQLLATHRRWRRTVGEEILRIVGILATLGALAVTWHYIDQSSVRERSARECPVPAPSLDVASRVLLVAADDAGLRHAQTAALEEAVASYFGVQVRSLAIRDYQDVALDQADVLLFFGNATFTGADTVLVSNMLERASSRSMPMAWVGLGAHPYAERLGLMVAEPDGISARAAPEGTFIEYHGAGIPADNLLLPRALAPAPNVEANIVARLALPDGTSQPAVIVEPGLVYVGFMPFRDLESNLALSATMDALSVILGEHERDRRVFLRLEDINGVDYGPDDSSLVATTTLLLKKHVFMHLSMIPIYVDRAGDVVAEIGAVKHLRQLIANHAESVEVIQHGSRHHRLDPRNAGMQSGDAYEFFLDDDLTMGASAAARFARERMEEGRAVLARNGWSPVIFEAPHYHLSPAEQAVADTMYPVMHHPPLFQADLTSQLFTPWFTRRGDTIYAPSTLGYVDALDPNSVPAMLYKLEQLGHVLPDPVVIIHFHPFMSQMAGREGDLLTLVNGVRQRGYRFASNREELSQCLKWP